MTGERTIKFTELSMADQMKIPIKDNRLPKKQIRTKRSTNKDMAIHIDYQKLEGI